jgi:nickel-dependent lactate racemase
MTTLNYKFGKSFRGLHLDKDVDVDLIIPNSSPADARENIFKDIFLKLSAFFQEIEMEVSELKIGIAINDKSRPVPYPDLIPPLMDALRKLSVSDSQIHFFVANGTHEADAGSLQHYFPKSYLNEYEFHQHDCLDKDNLIYLGTTTRNSRVFINKNFYECDLKIAVGNIEPHHFAGFSGGYKTVAIGLAGKQTITENHRLLFDADSIATNFATNPLRQDIEEIGKMSGLHFCLNCIINKDKKIIRELFDVPSRVMEIGIPVVQSIYTVAVKCRYDFVIASAGGYPKDINLYQAQKALTNASRICTENGTILLLAECIEGLGSPAFEEYMPQFTNPTDIIQDFTANAFQLGRHKAYQIARILLNRHIAIYSALEPELIRKLLLTPVANPTEFIGKMVKPGTTVAFIPQAVITIPKCIEN